jgi:flagellar hook-basal body protein
MMASLFSGVSGLKNHQVKMNVIGNNIANINTIGYKSSRVNFQEALVQTFRGAGRPSSVSGGTNPVQLGLGMQVASIDNLFLQGGLETTGQITDLAIQGAGFFILGDTNGNMFYTRAGAFGLDANSNLVDPASGLYVMGKMADTSGVIPSQATTEPIRLPFGQQDPARATEEVDLSNNIDTSATESNAIAIDFGGSGVSSVSGTALNGVGGTHSVSIVGAQATHSTFTGTVDTGGLSTTLGALGVTDFSTFQIVIDTQSYDISGLNAASTVEDVINYINQIPGVTATMTTVAPTNRVVLTRDYAGDSTAYSILSSSSAWQGYLVWL